MRIFDNTLLAQYLDVGAKVKVFTAGKWYIIVDKTDVSDPIDAVGYDEYQKAHYFSYQTIEQIEVNGQTITLDMLAKKMDGDSSKATPKKSSKEPKPEDNLDAEEPPKESEPKQKAPDLSWFSPAYDIGRALMQENERVKRGNKI